MMRMVAMVAWGWWGWWMWWHGDDEDGGRRERGWWP